MPCAEAGKWGGGGHVIIQSYVCVLWCFFFFKPTGVQVKSEVWCEVWPFKMKNSTRTMRLIL